MTPDEATSRAMHLLDLIASPIAASIYGTHPNTLGASLLDENERSFTVPSEWDDWWQWCGERGDSWISLINFAAGSDACDLEAGDHVKDRSDICNPAGSLIRLLAEARRHSLPRQPDLERSLRGGSLSISHTGMSSKKHHEVSRMASLVLDLLDNLREQHSTEIRHVVDIGAGQGCLSRALCEARDLHVLALDSSQWQVEGSSRQSQKSISKGTLTYQSIWLGEGPSFETHPGLQGSKLKNTKSLEEVIDEWLDGFEQQAASSRIAENGTSPVPVVFVALHACGSLTPSILQEVLNHRLGHAFAGKPWFVAAAVVVGCCYNLMRKQDFPLSQVLGRYSRENYPGFELSSSHLQLAAQIPSTWLRTSEAASATELSMRKVLYRALIVPLLSRASGDEASQKLGKLNSRAYETLEIFLCWAGRRIGMDLLSSFKEAITEEPDAVEGGRLARRIKTLHALRCLLGPPVESLIILDRYLWLTEELGSDSRLTVDLINLFDQNIGSGRNVALVLSPS